MSNLNDEIREAIGSFNDDHARALLREAFKNNPDADTYYLASQVAVDEEEKRDFLVKATELDPLHSEAHAALGATVQHKPAELAAPTQQETAFATIVLPPEPTEENSPTIQPILTDSSTPASAPTPPTATNGEVNLMSNLNDEIRAAIDTFDVDKARALLREALNNNPDAETYYLASQVAIHEEQKRDFLVKATQLDPFHSEAHAALGATVQNKPAELAAPTQQETALATTPPEPPAEAKNTKLVTASVIDETSLKVYPWGDAPDRTTLPAGAIVIPMTRTESGNWLNVFYVGTTGREIVGWIEQSAMNQPRLADRDIEIKDFPITEFEFNGKQDIIDFRKKLAAYHQKRHMPGAIGAIIAAPLFFLGMLAFAEPIFGIFFVFGIIALVVGLANNNKGPNLIAVNLGESWTGTTGGAHSWHKKLEALRRSKQSGQENQREDQARQLALGSAVVLGGIALNHLMSNQNQRPRQQPKTAQQVRLPRSADDLLRQEAAQRQAQQAQARAQQQAQAQQQSQQKSDSEAKERQRQEEERRRQEVEHRRQEAERDELRRRQLEEAQFWADREAEKNRAAEEAARRAEEAARRADEAARHAADDDYWRGAGR
jgi:hypothetical protein